MEADKLAKSSLFEYDDVTDRIIQERQSTADPIVVVEGRRDASFGRRVLSDGVRFFPAGTRDRVLQTAQKLHNHGIRFVACVVDRDFDNSVRQFEQLKLPIAVYDNGDLEAMLITVPTLFDLLDEFCNEAKLVEFGGADAVRERIVGLAQQIGSVRHYNAIRKLGLNFANLDLRRRIKDRKAVDDLVSNLNIPAFLSGLIAVSGVAEDPEVEELDAKTVLANFDSSKQALCPTTSKPLFRGKDALVILSVLMSRVLGNQKHLEEFDETLEAALRVAAKEEHLRETYWWGRVHHLLSE